MAEGKTLSEKLSNIQSELKVPKNQYNEFGKYNYRSCEDILEAIKPLLKKQGLTLIISDELESVGGRNYIKAVVTLSDGKDIRVCGGVAREAESRKGMDAAQITGAASSYARKYALNGMFLIDDIKDADTKNNTKAKSETKKEEKEPIKEKLRNLILSEIDREGKSKDDIASEAQMMLEEVARFTDKEGSEVVPESLEKMSDKWAYSAYGNLKNQIEEARAGNG